MHLLLTRPTAEAVRTRAKLEGMGHRVIVAPVIAIRALPARWPDDPVDALLATSTHAFTVRDIENGPPLDERRRMPLLLVGARTHAAARQRGFEGDAIVAASAAELGARIGELAGARRRMVYLAGRDRKPDLENALRMIGQTVDVCEVYEAAAVAALDAATTQALRTGDVEGVLHFSQRSAALFLALAAKADVPTQRLRHFCLSDDVAKPLRGSGSQRIFVAATPDEAALLATVADQA